MNTYELQTLLNGKLCLCGRPTDALDTVITILGVFENEEEPAYLAFDRLLPDVGSRFLCLYLINSLGWIEHGGGVQASWLTPVGEDVLAALRVEKARDNFDTLLHAQLDGPEDT